MVTCHGNNKLIQRPMTLSQEQFIYDPVRLISVTAIVRDCCENVLENSGEALKMCLVCTICPEDFRTGNRSERNSFLRVNPGVLVRAWR